MEYEEVKSLKKGDTIKKIGSEKRAKVIEIANVEYGEFKGASIKCSDNDHDVWYGFTQVVRD